MLLIGSPNLYWVPKIVLSVPLKQPCWDHMYPVAYWRTCRNFLFCDADMRILSSTQTFEPIKVGRVHFTNMRLLTIAEFRIRYKGIQALRLWIRASLVSIFPTNTYILVPFMFTSARLLSSMLFVRAKMCCHPQFAVRCFKPTIFDTVQF